MGSFDGKEICEAVGLYILQSLENRFGSNIGLYRDDGLGVIQTSSGRLAENRTANQMMTHSTSTVHLTTRHQSYDNYHLH